MKKIQVVILLVAVSGVPLLPAQERAVKPAPAGSAAGKSQPKFTGNYEADAEVLRESQAQALEMAQALREKAKNPQAQASVDDVVKRMEQALKLLEEAKNSPAKLEAAVASQQAAYQALLQLAAREHQVTRSKGKAGGEPGEQSRKQLENLEMTEAENRYETQRQAAAPKNAAPREQLQVLSRLKELAQRQQDVNERLKELQTALQEARTEQERAEVRRRLKRLREEQQQMLADVDELKQRMERPENQSKLAQQRDQLDQTRDQVRQAAEAMEKGSVPQALASGTRAQRDLQQLRDELRKQNSNQFSEEMRQMRADARELAQKEEEIGKKMDALGDNKRKTLTGSGERKELAAQLDGQKQRLTNLLAQAAEVTEQAESAEPLLAKQLYDTIRRNAQTDAKNLKDMTDELLKRGLMSQSLYDRLQKSAEAGKPFELTAELLRQGFQPQAGAAEQRVRKGVDELKRGVERAAESVLGDEAESLRQARKELDALTDELNKEIAQADPNAAKAGGQPANNEAAARDPAKSDSGNQKPEQMAQAGKEPGQSPGKGKGQPGEQNGKSDQPGEPSKGSPGEGGGKGESAQAGQGKGGGQQAGNEPGPGNRPPPSLTRRSPTRNRPNGGSSGGGMEGGWLNNNGGGATGLGPIRGEEYGQWSDRLRDVEEMIDLPDLRNEVARIREEAREIRRGVRQESHKPDWAVVRLKIAGPLVEVRNRIDEELAKRESKDPLVPLDRDPVPGKYSELVRRYYQELGKDK